MRRQQVVSRNITPDEALIRARRRFRCSLMCGCIATLVMFPIMIYLIRTVNPPPLNPEEKSKQGANQDSQQGANQQNAPVQDLTGKWHDETRRKKNLNITSQDGLQKNIKMVIPPLWPRKPERSTLINETNLTPQDRMVNETVASKFSGSEPNRTTPYMNDTLSLMSKRSVSEDKKLQDELNSVILKIIDASGKFNIEIKIGSNNASSEIKNETRENKTNSDKPKYRMSLKTNNNDDLIIKLAKTLIVSIMPNDSVTVDEYHNHDIIAKTEVKNNIVADNTADLNSIIKCDINCNKYTVMPNYKYVFKPIVMFYNQTKVIESKNNGKWDLLEKNNNISDESNMDLNNLVAENNTDNNLAMPMETTTLEDAVTLITHENKIIEIEKVTISTKALVSEHETSTTENENSNLNANGSSIQNYTGNLIEMEELLEKSTTINI